MHAESLNTNKTDRYYPVHSHSSPSCLLLLCHHCPVTIYFSIFTNSLLRVFTMPSVMKSSRAFQETLLWRPTNLTHLFTSSNITLQGGLFKNKDAFSPWVFWQFEIIFCIYTYIYYISLLCLKITYILLQFQNIIFFVLEKRGRHLYYLMIYTHSLQQMAFCEWK